MYHGGIPIKDSAGDVIAQVAPGHTDDVPLIAAAPEMYVALFSILAEYVPQDFSNETPASVVARAALAKAEGKS